MKRKLKKIIETIAIIALIVALVATCIISDTLCLLIPLVIAIVVFGIAAFFGTLLVSATITYFNKMGW